MHFSSGVEVELEEEVDTYEKGPHILQSEVEKAIERIESLPEMMIYLEMCSNYWEKVV